VVEFLWHIPIPGPQAGLSVCHGDAELCRRQGGRQCRIGVAVGNHHVGFLVEVDPIELGEHGTGLHAVGTRPYSEVGDWFRQFELGKEQLRHLVVVVLTGVDEGTGDVGSCRDLASQRSRLHELGPGSDNRDGLQWHIEYGGLFG